jgi:hypothetical protein
MCIATYTIVDISMGITQNVPPEAYACPRWPDLAVKHLQDAASVRAGRF